MSIRNRRILMIVFAAFVLAYGGLLYLFHYETEQFAVEQAEKNIEDVLLGHRALHSYIEDVQKPQFYKLKREGKLYQEYFQPEVLSFTFIARGVKDYLNKEREKAGLPQIYFKLATDNPRNPINEADEYERQILNRMRDGKIEKYTEIREFDGERVLYQALPINRSAKSCMRCHGDPKDAPAELIARYGDKAGFWEDVDNIRAFISIRMPLKQYIEEGHGVFYILAITTFSAMTVIYLLITYFIRHQDRQERMILAKNSELEQLSATDGLTGIYNRMRFNELLEHYLQKSIRSHHDFGLVMFDIDHFKQINDRYGHLKGDEALKWVAELTRQSVRSSDVVARWGGEEFALLLPDTDLEGSQTLAENLRKNIAAGRHGPDEPLSASFGVTVYSEGDSLETLLARADEALYRAKDEGRNRVSVNVAKPA